MYFEGRCAQKYKKSEKKPQITADFERMLRDNISRTQKRKKNVKMRKKPCVFERVKTKNPTDCKKHAGYEMFFGNFWIFGRGGVENPNRRADVEERSLREILHERYDNRKNGQE